MIIMYEVQKVDGPIVAHITSTENRKELESFATRINYDTDIPETHGDAPITISVNGYKRRIAHKRGAEIVTEEEFNKQGVR